MTTPVYIPDHAARATAALAEQYKNKIRLAGLLGALGTTQIQALEDALCGPVGAEVVALLAGATGTLLDTIGKIVGQPRNGLLDAAYVTWIKARIAVNRSSGTIEDVLGVFALLVTAPQTLALVEEGTTSFVLRLLGAAISNATDFSGILKLAKAAGVHSILEYLGTGTAATTFTLDGTGAQALDNGTFANAL